MKNRIEEIQDLLDQAKEDYFKGLHGNKYAGQRARKVLSEIRYAAIDARAEVMQGIKKKRGLA